MIENCPNCGHKLVRYRTDRQRVSQGEVTMQWDMCTHCRHIALERWTFGEPPSEKDHEERAGSAMARRQNP
jgi:endogenous inhibitor of DNA gyrase (YacG/DUF329 family)